MEIVGGSGYFHVAASDPSLAEIEYDVSRPREVVTTPSLDGDLVIEAFDLCVDGSASAKTNVHIAGNRGNLSGNKTSCGLCCYSLLLLVFCINPFCVNV